mgnify:CR=1 FL=1
MGNDGHNKQRDLSYTQNRELSWLRFDERVLSESLDDTVPLFERLKFIAIFESNMHEFLMVRMGGLSSLATLKRQPRDNKSGMTPSEQVAAVFSALPGLFSKAASSLDAIESLLRAKGIERITPSELIGAERDAVRSYFDRNVLPIFSPLIIDPRHPLPQPAQRSPLHRLHARRRLRRRTRAPRHHRGPKLAPPASSRSRETTASCATSCSRMSSWRAWNRVLAPMSRRIAR